MYCTITTCARDYYHYHMGDYYHYHMGDYHHYRSRKSTHLYSVAGHARHYARILMPVTRILKHSYPVAGHASLKTFVSCCH